MATQFGVVIANVMSAVARVLGYVIYGLLRAIYRPKDRMLALGGIGIVAILALIIWGLLR